MKASHTELIVRALKNGTVIDHIPADKLFKIVSILELDQLEQQITIGNNLESKKLGKKGVIKIADKVFKAEELNKLALLAPSARINIVENYEVVEKIDLSLPESVHEILQCVNPMCITNKQPVSTRFDLLDRKRGIFKCHYCERTVDLSEIVVK
ncbi:MAG: aspartate carbamoyltransferase regulatory subunit [Paludibacteraceae bacterium]|nr:aspartate carbamoyltransferase regulatory subunit [Paludibacteraceae bacterium]